MNGSDPKSLYHFALFCNINFSLFGVWALCTYIYFSIDIWNNNDNNDNRILIFTSSEIGTTTTRTTATTTRIESPQTEHDDRRSPSPPPSSQQQQQGEEEEATRMRRRSTRKYSFNIFDGTNASGEFAAFIHGGDSDDDNVDNEQTNHWDTIQDHI